MTSTLPPATPATPAAFFADDEPIDGARFSALATDPSHSVAIEACAGSGKTTLLVARITRILLSGAKPNEILAISFTRKAAAEILERVQAMLQRLANAHPDEAIALLDAMQVPDPHSQLARARGLYHSAFGAGASLSIATFHGWFMSLLQQLPLSAGVTPGFSLQEEMEHFYASVFHRWINLRTEAQIADLRTLYMALGDHTTHQLLRKFIDYRAEWRLAAGDEMVPDATHLAPYQWLVAACGPDGERDPRLDFFTPAHCDALQSLAQSLGLGTEVQQTIAQTIEAVLTEQQFDPAPALAIRLARFTALENIFLTQSGAPRKPPRSKPLPEDLPARWDSFIAMLSLTQQRAQDTEVVRLHLPLMRLGHHLVHFYQAEKNAARLLDFADLEFEMLRLMREEEYAAYFQARLEARSRHILIDEFQDTNPLQWQVLYAWLQGYVEVGEDLPSLFLVGDPKQSIYRFRRADPRVFDAAQEWLRGHIAGSVCLRTDHTWRNAAAITTGLNQLFRTNPRYRPHTTGAALAGAVTVLPLIPYPLADKLSAGATATLRDPLTAPATEHEHHLREWEGAQVATALLALQQEQHFAWDEVLLLMRKRTHLADYEYAFRAAGIPFSSDRHNPWQDSLEVSDCLALGRFLLFQDNHSLAQVLSSPSFDWPTERLTALATWIAEVAATHAATPSWFEALPDFIAASTDSTPLQIQLERLHTWISAARRLSIHDLFDRIFHEADMPACYARHHPPHELVQIERNLYAFLHATLNADSGRYPRLAQFLTDFHQLSNSAPAREQSGAQFMTIHGAKGKEARVVVLLDSNTAPRTDHLNVLIDWPLNQPGPTHFSTYWNRDSRGVARQAWFEAEAHYAAQEEWNLFYVACTRAKQFLLFSAPADGRKGQSGGLVEDSWYERAQRVFGHF